MKLFLITLAYGVGTILVTAPFAVLGGWLYITQGHWNAPYIIVSFSVSVLLIGACGAFAGWQLNKK